MIDTKGPTDVVMKLFGPDSETDVIAEDDDSGVGFNARIAGALVPGKYYVAGAPLQPQQRRRRLHRPGQKGLTAYRDRLVQPVLRKPGSNAVDRDVDAPAHAGKRRIVFIRSPTWPR